MLCRRSLRYGCHLLATRRRRAGRLQCTRTRHSTCRPEPSYKSHGSAPSLIGGRSPAIYQALDVSPATLQTLLQLARAAVGWCDVLGASTAGEPHARRWHHEAALGALRLLTVHLLALRASGIDRGATTTRAATTTLLHQSHTNFVRSRMLGSGVGCVCSGGAVWAPTYGHLPTYPPTRAQPSLFGRRPRGVFPPDEGRHVITARGAPRIRKGPRRTLHALC